MDRATKVFPFAGYFASPPSPSQNDRKTLVRLMFFFTFFVRRRSSAGGGGFMPRHTLLPSFLGDFCFLDDWEVVGFVGGWDKPPPCITSPNQIENNWSAKFWGESSKIVNFNN